jgi:hypothetical protein
MSLIHQTQPLNFASGDNQDEFSLFADALKTLRVDEIDPLDPEHGPAAVWKRICDSKYVTFIAYRKLNSKRFVQKMVLMYSMDLLTGSIIVTIICRLSRKNPGTSNEILGNSFKCSTPKELPPLSPQAQSSHPILTFHLSR